MNQYVLTIVETLEDGSKSMSTAGPFNSWSFASAAAHRFRTKRDAMGLDEGDVSVRVTRLIAPEDFAWVPPEQRPRAEIVQLRSGGKSRNTDPLTSRQADLFAATSSKSARMRLIEAHVSCPNGLTDEEACQKAGLNLASEYSTRCSELKRDGILEDTNRTRAGSTGLQRTVRQLTAAGLAFWEANR